MQSLYGQLQGFMCHAQQAQAEEKEIFLELCKEQQRIERSEKNSKVCKNQEKEENRKRAPALPENTDF